MSSRTLNRKQFLVFTASAVAASALAACGDDAVDPGGASGSGTGGSAGSGTAGSGTSGSGTSGSGTSGSGGSGTAGGGGSSAGKGGSGGSGGSAAGSGGSSAGSGGSTAGSGGSSAGSGGSGGGGMCGSVSMISQTSSEPHDHILADQTMLKMDLKTFINMAVADVTEFTVPNEGQGAGHTHKLKLTAQQLASLKGGGMATGVKTSMDENHTHTYTIVCMA
jgi:hypothetical protein